MNKTTTILEENSLILHYYFNDDSHSIDASVRNKCEREFIKIVRTISIELGVQIEIEINPKGKGGLIDLYTFLISNKEVIAIGIPSITLILQLVQLILSRKTNADKEEQSLAIEHHKLAIAELKSKLAQNQSTDIIKGKIEDIVNNNIKIKKHKSNFYKILNSYSKVIKIESTIPPTQSINNSTTITIERKDFMDFVLETDELDSIIDEDATIEVVSPVLRKGKYKWRGIYNNAYGTIEFSMLDKDFKERISKDNIVFQNGTCLNCILKSDRKIDNDGNTFVSNYSATTVLSHYIGDIKIETKKGEQLRKKKEANKLQTKFDFDTN